MIALIQRVSQARVETGGGVVGEIGRGIVALVAVERGDGEAEAARLAERVIGYRIFPDAAGKMNLSLADAGGDLLAVPQFTLAADTAEGARLFERFVALARERHPGVQTGRFGADMQVSLVNDGPVTFWLQVQPPRPGV